MPDKAQKKEETKKLIRSILATTPVQLGVKLTDFLRDYKELAGGPLPCRALGYNNEQDFLGDIPDVVHMSYDRGELILRCVADESMQHVMNLVNNQKISAAQKKKRFRPSRRSAGPPSSAMRYVPPHQRRHHGGQQNYRYEPPPRMRGHRNRNDYDEDSQVKPLLRPVVTPFVQHKIRELCLSYPSGLLCSDFAQAMHRRFGQQLNYSHFGFASLLEMFESLDNILEIKYLSNGEYKLFARKNAAPSHGKLSDGEIIVIAI